MNRTESYTDERTNERTNEQKDENYIPLGINTLVLRFYLDKNLNLVYGRMDVQMYLCPRWAKAAGA